MGKPIVLESYFEIIDRCAEHEENFEISNTDVVHASYLIKTLFKHAKSEVCIFSGQLFEGVFGNEDLQSKAREFLSVDDTRKLKVAYQEKVTKDDIVKGKFLSSILSDEARKGSVEVWDASKVFPNDGYHFTVMDKKAFRFETNHVTRNAKANFGDKKTAEGLADVFNLITTKSSKVFSTID